MHKSKSILWTAVKSIVVNTLIVLAFSGLFRSSLLIDKPSYGFYGATLITLMYMFIRPLLMFISIVPIIMTFGIFIVVINAGLILFVSYLLSPHFVVSYFGSAFFLAIFISIFNALLNSGDRKIIIKQNGKFLEKEYKFLRIDRRGNLSLIGKGDEDEIKFTSLEFKVI